MMFIFKLIGLVALLAYAGLSLYGLAGYLKLKIFNVDPSYIASTPVSVIVCARNEEHTIERCLRSIAGQAYDKELLEVIVVNDASSDNTLAVAELFLKSSGLRFRLISNDTQQGKKRSLTKAIDQCSGALIITRDADTYTESNTWLSTIVAFHEQTGKEFIIAPVCVEQRNSLLTTLQTFENDALAILTAGFAAQQKPFLCNGANLAFTKKLFLKTKGYSSHLDTASGDDVLFLEEVKKAAPASIGYLRNAKATVCTYPHRTLKELIDQRVRWASKAEVNPNPLNQVFGLVVLLTHLFTLFLIVRAAFALQIPAFGLFFILSRFFIDFLLLFLASRYFSKALYWWWLPLSWLCYSALVTVVGILSWFYKPKWK